MNATFAQHTQYSSHWNYGLGATVRVYCIVCVLLLGGRPFSWGIRLALSLRPKEKTHVRYGANKWCLQSNRMKERLSARKYRVCVIMSVAQ
jgi:hypothetical protein